ncbi:MAG TPA: rhodanese-like domain-containing protein [Flavobacterium sp.]|nr:rhodanese-like domain-containing protein [Flavobacterium sp.]
METNPINNTSEFTKTNWITFGVIAVILVLVLSFIFLKTEKYTFKTPLDKELADIKMVGFQASPQSVANAILSNDKSIILVDVRSQFDYAKGHLPDAKNIYSVNLMDDANMDFFNTLKESNKKAILYANSASEANVPFMILKQMGIENISYLSVGYDDLKSGNWTEIAANPAKYSDETAVVDFAKFISDANKSKNKVKTVVAQPTVVKQKVSVKPVKVEAEKDEGC